jgi:uncharacterized metal-binding protein
MGKANPHECGGGETLIFACSGAADVGEISDRAARQLTRAGAGKMFCLAGVGGHIQGILDKTRAATRVLALDGCPLDCVKKTLEHAGCTEFHHVRATDLGMEKGKAPLTEQNVQVMVSAARSLLA